MDCLFFLPTLLLTISINRLSSGQPLKTDRRSNVETARMEQRLLLQIRPLLTEICNGDQKYSQHLSELTEEIQALTRRVRNIEDTVVLPGMVKFPRETSVDTILLRGRNYPLYHSWVELYRVLYSMDGTTWTSVKADNQLHVPRVFTGNSDISTIVKSSLVPSITAVYLRINPRTWHNHISLRFDVGGCYSVRETRPNIHKALGFRPILNGGTLFKVNERAHNQLDAARLCTQQYSQLIEVDSSSLMAGLQAVVNGNDILRNAHNQMYVSGSYVSNQWQYSDNVGVIDSALWSPGNPDPTQGHCVMLTTAGLASVNCSQDLFSVCGHI